MAETANTFTNLVNKIFAKGLLALRENSVMPRLVNTDWGAEVAKKGTTIDVPIPSAVDVSDVAPGPYPPDAAASSPTTVQITLDRWKKTDMYLTDKEAQEIAVGARDTQLSEHLRALANYVDSDILALFKGVYGFAGTPGTNPFGNATPSLVDATLVRKILAEQRCPTAPRHFVLDPTAEAIAEQIEAVQNAMWRKNADSLTTGQIGDILGFRFWMDQNIQSMINGTLTDGAGHKALFNGGGSPANVGDATADFDATSLTGTVKQGEVFTVAGDSQTYVVTEDATASGNAITLKISPTIQVAWADNAQMTLKGAASAVSPQNLAFHRDAFALAVRPLAPADGFTGGHEIRTGVDPVSGLSLSLEVARDYMQTRYTWSILYGVKLVRPELACRLAG